MRSITALVIVMFTAPACDGDLDPIVGPGDAAADSSVDALADSTTDALPDATDTSPPDTGGPDEQLPDTEPLECLSLGAQVCRTAKCNEYASCAEGEGVCAESKNCCEGACEEIP